MTKKLKILYLLPIKEGNHDMPYARRQIDRMRREFNIDTKIFFLENRSSLAYLLAARKRFRKLIADFNPDICHAHYGSVNSLFAAVSCRKPLVITYHGSDLNKTPTDGLVADFLARLFSNIASLRAKKILVVSEELKKKLWWRQKDVYVIPVGTNTNEFFPLEKSEAKKITKDFFHIPFPSVVFNANNPSIKRLDIAEDVIKELKKTYPEAKLIKLSGNVDPQIMPAVLNAADVLLLCSDNEGSPTIIKEAMACNLPIVATDVGDVKLRIEHVNEALIAEQNIDSIITCIKKILNTKFNKNGRQELLNQQLDESTLQRKIHDLYKSSVNN